MRLMGFLQYVKSVGILATFPCKVMGSEIIDREFVTNRARSAHRQECAREQAMGTQVMLIPVTGGTMISRGGGKPIGIDSEAGIMKRKRPRSLSEIQVVVTVAAFCS